MTSISLSSPYTVFPLSQPLQQTPHGAKNSGGEKRRKCYTSPVDSKKQKRKGITEIAVAVDGEGVNIYDVRATQVLSTYALPPAIKFSCPPVSSVTRVSKSTFSRRTYAATSSPQKQLVCWEENEISTTSNGNGESIPVTPLSRDSGKHGVVHLCNPSNTGGVGLLAVFGNGCISCFSADLEKRWEFQPPRLALAAAGGKGSGLPVVVYAVTTDLATAEKALLVNRPDITLPNTTDEGDMSGDIVLFTVVRRGGSFHIRLFMIPIEHNGGKSPREVLTSPLSALNGDNAIFSLHLHSAMLYGLTATSLITFSLASTMPSVVSSLPLPCGAGSTPLLFSLLRVSSSAVLVVTNQDISLYDTKFSSLQARTVLQPISASTPSTPSMDLPRTSTPASEIDGRPRGQIFLTTYMQDLDMAIGYSQAGIVGVQLSRTGSKGGNQDGLKSSGLLIDSLCRGIQGIKAAVTKTDTTAVPEAKRILLKLESERSATREAIANLREARSRNNLVQFEEIFADHIGVERQVETEVVEDGDSVMANGISGSEKVAESKKSHSPEPLPEFVPSENDQRAANFYKPLRHEFVVAVSNMIFEPSITEDMGQKLEISFYPHNVVKYLIESGNFPETFLRSGSGITQCLAELDPTLRTLGWALAAAGEMSAGETVSAIEIALEHKLAVDRIGDNEIALRVIRSEVMRLALIRLNAFPSLVIIKALKTGLKAQDLMTLIELLRKELLVDRQPSDESDIGIGIEDVGVVSDLLIVALDTIGIGGLVLSHGSEEFIQELHGEVSNAVQAAEEAAGLKGILKEMFRHADWRRMAAEKKRPQESKTSINKRLKRKNAERKASPAQREGVRRAQKRSQTARKEVRKEVGKEEKEQEGDKETTNPGSREGESSPRGSPEPSIAPPKDGQPTKPAYESVDPVWQAKDPERKVEHVRIASERLPDTQASEGKKPARREIPAKSVSVRRNLVQAHEPVSVPSSSAISPLLPLGVLPPPVSRISLLTQPGDKGGRTNWQELKDLKRRKGREASYRESMVAGVYSVESMVV